MAKGWLDGIIESITGPLGVHTRPEGSAPPIQTSIQPMDDYFVLVARKPRKNDPSTAQIAQRQKYSDCDCLWKHRDKEQAAAWKVYIDTERKEERKGKDYYRPFMSDCLRFDLSAYLTGYLFAEWQLISVTNTSENLCITIKMGSSLDHNEPDFSADPSAGATLII